MLLLCTSLLVIHFVSCSEIFLIMGPLIVCKKYVFRLLIKRTAFCVYRFVMGVIHTIYHGSWSCLPLWTDTYMSTLRLVHYALLLTHMLEIQQYKCKTHGFCIFSCFGPHIWKSPHKILDTAQACHLLKPN